MKRLPFVTMLLGIFGCIFFVLAEPSPPSQVTFTINDQDTATFDPSNLRSKFQQKNYNNFRYIPPNHTIDQTDLTSTPILLGDGNYKVNNPLLIDEKNPVFMIHGVDRMYSVLSPINSDKPLFVINKAQYVNISNLHLQGFNKPNGINLLSEGNANIALDVIDCFVEKGSFSFNAPGSYRLQGSYFTGQGLVASQIILNNNLADLYIFGGNITNSGIEKGAATSEYSHAWIKSGRFRIFGTGVQGSRGFADFRIDAPTVMEKPHQIINVRSEGNNGRIEGGSAFIFTASSPQSIDIDIVNSAGSWGLSGASKSTFAIYNGAGKLRLIGNSATEGVGQLISRSSSFNYQLTAMANTLANSPASPPTPGSATMVSNLFAGPRIGGKILSFPQYKIANVGETLSRIRLDIEIPPLVARPSLDKALPNMLNVKDFGAKGDGSNNDTYAIQKAINAGRSIYFPAGNYKINKAIAFNTDKTNDHGAGGFIAGAGSDKVIIERAGGGSLFETRGMAYATVQGITFKVSGPQNDDPALSIEFTSGIGHATQSNSFYDLIIDGAPIGVAIGTLSPTQCSENLFNGLTIKNAKMGISVGSYNALANIFTNLQMENIGTAIGQGGALTGGSWSVVNGNFVNTGKLFDYLNSSDGIFFYDNIKASQTILFSTNDTGATFNSFFNSTHITNSIIKLKSSGGVIFNNSVLSTLGGEAQGFVGENYIINNTDSRIKNSIEIKKGTTFLEP